MKDKTNKQEINSTIELCLADDNDIEEIQRLGVALSSFDRVCILQLLMYRGVMTLTEISKELHIAVSSVLYHIDALEKAGLILVQYKPGKRGNAKLCRKIVAHIEVKLYGDSREIEKIPVTESMDVGQYVECNISAPCGLAGKDRLITQDNPKHMFIRDRKDAELLWMSAGDVTYQFTNLYREASRKYNSISFSFEICSETIGYKNNWPSDITIWINDVEVATFTSLGDFGGRRGNFTPKFWQESATQFGVLKTITVNETGVYVDRQIVTDLIKIDKLKLDVNDFIRLKIGIKENAEHVGGINLFGENFGDFKQAILMTLS